MIHPQNVSFSWQADSSTVGLSVLLTRMNTQLPATRVHHRFLLVSSIGNILATFNCQFDANQN